ncbi:hypothetical protein Tco_0005732 [Tanacetum coccineum]
MQLFYSYSEGGTWTLSAECLRCSTCLSCVVFKLASLAPLYLRGRAEACVRHLGALLLTDLSEINVDELSCCFPIVKGNRFPTAHLAKHNTNISSISHSESTVIGCAFHLAELRTGPYVLADQTKSVSEGLETILTQPRKGKRARSIARQIEEEASNTIKLEDLAKLVSNVQPSFKDLDSPEDDPVIVFDDSDKDKEDEVHTTTKDTSVPKSSSPGSSQIQELTNQLNELPVKSLQTEFSKILSARDFSSSLPTELKDLPSKFNELTKEVKGLTSPVAELKTLQWELPAEFVSLPIQVASFQAKLKTLDALPSLLLNVTKALNKFAQVLDSASSKAGDQTKKNAEKENPNNQQPKPTPPPATTIIPPIITTITTQMQSPPQNPQKVSSEPEREHIKKDKVKKAMSSKDAKEVSTESDFNDEITHVPGSMVESSKKKDLKIFDFVTEDGEHVYLTEEQISAQKKIEEEAIAKVVKHERKIRKEELIDLLGPDVVNKYYNDKLQYDRYCDKMLNRIAKSRITNCDILTRKGPITLKVYREDDTSEIIPDFKASDLHPGEWREERMNYLRTTKAELRIDLDRPLSEQDPLDRLNDLENKKRKHADDIHDFFRANKRLKTHQGPGLDDHAMTFSSLLLAKIDKRNLNPLKQMRVIKLLSITQAEVFQFESLKFLQRQLFKSLEDWEVSSLQFMQRYINYKRLLVRALVQLG